MATVDKYTALITAEHADKPKYMAMVQTVAGSFADAFDFASTLPTAFDLDTGIGAQLDAIGLWVGLSRNISTPLSAYFSFDTDGLGFDQGNWQGPFDPTQGITTLDDSTYRVMLRIKIGANSWDSTLPGFIAITQRIFEGTSVSPFPLLVLGQATLPAYLGYMPVTSLFAVDNQDMSMSVYIVGAPASALFLALLAEKYFNLKPEGVSISYQKPSVDGTPLFGFDVQTANISGFDTGSWSVSI